MQKLIKQKYSTYVLCDCHVTNKIVCFYLMSLYVNYFVINIKEKYVVFNYCQVS